MLNKTEIDTVATHPIQSWVWGEFRKAWGNEVVRFKFGQITLHKIPFFIYKIGIFENALFFLISSRVIGVSSTTSCQSPVQVARL